MILNCERFAEGEEKEGINNLGLWRMYYALYLPSETPPNMAF